MKKGRFMLADDARLETPGKKEPAETFQDCILHLFLRLVRLMCQSIKIIVDVYVDSLLMLMKNPCCVILTSLQMHIQNSSPPDPSRLMQTAAQPHASVSSNEI